jgi:hypothetical protein
MMTGSFLDTGFVAENRPTSGMIKKEGVFNDGRGRARSREWVYISGPALPLAH